VGTVSSSRDRLASALVAVVVACSGETVGPVDGTLEVTASITGSGSDPDGFLVVVSRGMRRRLAPGEPVVLGPIPSGTQEVALEGIGPNCAAVDAATRSVTITAGDTTRVAFEVTCALAAGTLHVTVQTTGSDLDPNGYDVLVDGLRAAAVDPDGATFVSIPAGEHAISLRGLNPNCTVADPASRALALAIGGLAGVQFEIQCVPGARAGRGHEIAFNSEDPVTGRGTISVVNDDGSHREPLFPGIASRQITPAWAPDGNRIAFYQFPGDTLAILTVAEASGVPLAEFPEASSVSLLSPRMAWRPDGSVLATVGAFHDCSVRLVHLDGSPDQSLDPDCFSFTHTSVSWSPDGERLAFTGFAESNFGDPPTIFIGVTDVATPGESTEPAGCQYLEPSEVAWSPDGSRLAVADHGIEVLDLASSTCIRLTDEPSDVAPSWSPDGTRIAFSSSRDGNSEIYVMQADGSGITRLTRSPLADSAPSWRP
jgi:Tol biopolymer transport system component